MRSKIAFVSQDASLFDDTIKNNILNGNHKASQDEVKKAAQNAAAHDFIQSMPDGYETRVGTAGNFLSGGQKQRIAIARAFLKDAPVLILDEATSHLDAVNETAIRNELETLKANRTTIIIAHRLSTVRDADKIVVMEEGRIVETGTHEELLKKGGLYARLISRQLASTHNF